MLFLQLHLQISFGEACSLTIFSIRVIDHIYRLEIITLRFCLKDINNSVALRDDLAMVASLLKKLATKTEALFYSIFVIC